MIVVSNLKKTYSSKVRTGFFKSEIKEVEAVKGIDLQIKPGQIVGLLGINGAGKTTTIKMMSTLLSPSSGSVEIDGIDAVKNPFEVKRRVNMVSGGERMIYWRLTGRENLWYYGRLYDLGERELKERIQYLLDLVGLTDKADTPVERYSKGMKQRLQIARGLINNPSYILMDEPTLGLDAIIAKELREHIKRIASKEGKSILLTSHYLQEVEELCQYIYVMDKGLVVAEGTSRELAQRAWEQKVMKIELHSPNSSFHHDILRLCNTVSESTVETAEDNSIYTIKSKEDVSKEIAKLLLNHNMPAKSFYTVEPNLEDAIIKLSKGA